MCGRRRRTTAAGVHEMVGGVLMPPSTKVTSRVRARALVSQRLTCARTREQIIDVVWSEPVSEHDGTFEFPRAAMCTARLAACGPGRLNDDGVPNPCCLRHRDPIPLTALRPPILMGDFSPRDVSESDASPQRLRLTPGALQEVTSVLEDDIQLGLYVN